MCQKLIASSSCIFTALAVQSSEGKNATCNGYKRCMNLPYLRLVSKVLQYKIKRGHKKLMRFASMRPIAIGLVCKRLTVARRIVTGCRWQFTMLSWSSGRAVAVISSGGVVTSSFNARRGCAMVNGLLECARERVENGQLNRIRKVHCSLGTILIAQISNCHRDEGRLWLVVESLTGKNALQIHRPFCGNQSSGLWDPPPNPIRS